MADNATIIGASLDSKVLENAINKLVRDVNEGMLKAADNFDAGVQLMESSLRSFSVNAKTTATEIKDTFRQLGTTFDDFAKAMQKASVAAGNIGSGVRGGVSSQGVAAPDTVGELRQQIAEAERLLNTYRQNSAELQRQVDALAKQKAELRNMLTDSETLSKRSVTKEFGRINAMPTRELAQAEAKLRELQTLAAKPTTKGILDPVQWQRLQTAIDRTQAKVEALKAKLSAPTQTMGGVLGMSEKSIDDIARKMQAITQFRGSLNTETQRAQINQLNAEYGRLAARQNELLGRNAQLTASNNGLARSFGYIRNRLVYAFSIGAMVNFVNDMKRIRAEYEMLERSLGILIGDMERGTQVFNELNQMALKSPFTLIELGTAAKQLTAYNFAADEVVDTTRRLADISSALGVPMERLTYNLGQIKAQGVLNARDARDFANAGLAIVPMLAQMYTEQKRFGDQVVTTAQVYDMMSKKLVTYSDVLNIVYKITDEGGKFFNFQARQADTLKVQIANLSLAYNNMMNEIGTQQQGILTGGIKSVKWLFENWKEVARVIKSLILTFGVYKTVQALTFASGGRGIKTLIRSFVGFVGAINSGSAALTAFRSVMATIPLVGWVTAIAGLLSYFVLFKETAQETSVEMERFGESGAKALKRIETLRTILNGVDETGSTYKKTLEEIKTITDEYGVTLDTEKASREEINKAIERSIELIKEESSERQLANQIDLASETYNKNLENARKEFVNDLTGMLWVKDGGLPDGVEDFLKNNVDAITPIIEEIVSNNINLILGKTGDDLEKGMETIIAKINERLIKLGAPKGTDISAIATGMFSGTSAVEAFATSLSSANEKYKEHIRIARENKKLADENTQSTMSFTDKVNSNARALKKSASDATQLYNKIYDIVQTFAKTHTINFDLKLTAQNPPKWMFDKGIPELERLARIFAAAAKSGGRVKGYTAEETAERALQYGSAYRTKQEEADRKAREKENKTAKTRKDNTDKLLAALKEEISLVKKLQSEYDKLVQKGMPVADALEYIQGTFKDTIEYLNKDLKGFGLPQLDLKIIQGKDPNKQLAYFEQLRDLLESKGLMNLGRAKALNAIIEELQVKANVYNLDMITQGLNNELSKLKDDYELGIELSADPEMGDMFAKAFNIDVEALPKSFGEALDMANKIVKDKLKELKIDIHNFGLLDTLIEPDGENKWAGLDFNSKPVQDLIKLQKTWRDMFTNIMKDNEKVLDDYVKKYGNYSDRVAELEADRLEKIKRLNDQYREDQRRSDPDYKAKMTAIEQGTSKELGRLRFEEFKNSQYYVAMFEDIEHASSSALSAIRDRLSSLKDSLNELSPEQMKWVVQQYEKINQELLSRNPFKGLAGNVKNYIEALKKGGDAQEKFLQAQDEYDAQLKQVTMWKTILKLRERGTRIGGKEIQHISKMSSLQEDLVSEYVAENDINNMSIDQIKGQVTEADKLLQTLYEILQVAQANNDKFNYAKKILKDQGVAIAKAVGQNLQSLGELRDFITQDLGIEISAELDGMVDGLTKTGEGVNKIVSSLENADFVGALVGVGQVFYGLYDTVASIFGEGSAREKRITRQIEESERAVKRLENTYKSLEHTASNAYGAMTSGASYATKANKELQLVELQRQLILEKSRKKKKQDQDKIIELEGQIMDLKNELNDATRDIVNDLLGISSAGDGIENLVSVMIEAFRNGEDAMEAFGKEWDKMIDNMILKLIVSTFMQKEWDKIMAYLNKREEEMLKSPADAVQKAQAEYDKIAAMSDAEIARIINPLGSILGGKTVTPQQIKDYREAAKKALTDSTEVLNKASYDYTKWTMEYMNTEGRAQMTSMAELLKNSLGDWYTFGENNAKDLSALQAGISQISETTANSIEAYLNGISQQVYLQSNILTQIRDAVLAIDHNAQTATQAEMLLQLQNNYILMQTMQSMMENWTVPSGQGIRVELMS